jgi:transcriptional regulator with XRE-family HTH domain
MNITSAIIKRLRDKKNITLEELVIEVNEKFNININKNMIVKWESGKSNPKYDQLKCLASYYKVTADFLLGFDLDEFVDVIDLRNDLEIIKMTNEMKEKYAMIING